MSLLHRENGMIYKKLSSLRFASLLFLFILKCSLVLAWTIETQGKTAFYNISADSSGQHLTAFVMRGGGWESLNGGLTWEPMNHRFDDHSNFTGDRQVLNSGSTDTMIFHLASTTFDHYYTYDSGENWHLMPRPRPDQTNGDDYIIIDRNDSQTWYLLCRNQMSKTTNCGLSWSTWQYDDRLFQKFGFKRDIFNDSTFYFNTFYIRDIGQQLHLGGLIRSDDYCETWNHSNPMINLFDDFGGVTNALVLSALQMSNGEYIASIHCFESPGDWSRGTFVIVDSSGNPQGRFGFELPFMFYAEDIIEDVEIPGRLYAIGLPYYHLYSSDDYGRNWEICGGEGMPSGWQSIYGIFQNELSGDLYAAMEMEGLFKSEDNGGSWEKIPDPPVGCSGAVTTFQNSVFLKDSDGVNIWAQNPEVGIWSEVNLPLSEDSLLTTSRIYYQNGDTLVTKFNYFDMYGNGSARFVFSHSYDNGENWVEVNSMTTDLNHTTLSLYQSDTLYRIAMNNFSGDTLSYSEDLGFSWVNVPLIPNEMTIRTKLQRDDGIYLTYQNEIRYYDITDDTLVSLNYNGESLQNNVSMRMWNDTLYVFPIGGDLYVYDGEVWETRSNISVGSRDSGLEIIPNDPPLFVIQTPSQLGLYTSRDYGESWEFLEIDHELEQQNTLIAQIHYDRFRHRVWLCTGLGMIWIDADELIASVSTGEPPELHPAEVEVISTYPNPFNASTRITYNVTKPGDIKLRLYDITGRLVKECLKEYRTAGKHEYHLDASSLASGTYFMRLDMNCQAYVEKITLVK
jgi:type IX secretion system substrate protein